MDVVLIGSGVSATLLAQALVRRGCFRTLRIVDEPRPLRARRFAYWSDAPTPFDRFADAAWSSLRVVDRDGRATELALSRLVYRSFDPARWHEDAHRELRAAPGVEFVRARADLLGMHEHGVDVHAGGAWHRSDWTFSSVLPEEPPAAWQRFEGWEVQLPRRELDPAAATWMDFRTPAGGGDFRFMYALPLAPDRLLVEHVAYRPVHHAPHIRAYLRDVLGLRSWQLRAREAGATPLYRRPHRRAVGRLVRIGVAGGMAKACTGYALLRMWRDAERIAEGLAERGRPTLAARAGPLYRAADDLFLDLVEHAPDRLPGFLAKLAAGASGDAVLAFLDERASPLQRLEVACAAPGWLRWRLGGSLALRGTPVPASAAGNSPTPPAGIARRS